jgi:uncharacterized membrane protein YgaE (UPF0421/DUF939 family)
MPKKINIFRRLYRRLQAPTIPCSAATYANPIAAAAISFIQPVAITFVVTVVVAICVFITIAIAISFTITVCFIVGISISIAVFIVAIDEFVTVS